MKMFLINQPALQKCSRLRISRARLSDRRVLPIAISGVIHKLGKCVRVRATAYICAAVIWPKRNESARINASAYVSHFFKSAHVCVWCKSREEVASAILASRPRNGCVQIGRSDKRVHCGDGVCVCVCVMLIVAAYRRWHLRHSDCNCEYQLGAV